MLQETRAYFTELVRRDLEHHQPRRFRLRLPERPPRAALCLNQPARHSGDKPKNSKKPKVQQSPATSSQKIAASDLEVGSGLQKVKLDPASKRGGLVTQGADPQSHRRRHQHLARRARRLHQRAHPRQSHPAATARRSRHRARHPRSHEHPRPARQASQQRVLRLLPSNHRPTRLRARKLRPRRRLAHRLRQRRPRREGRSLRHAHPKARPSPTSPPGSRFTRNRADQLARGFATHFLTYSTGAPPRFSDEAALDAIAKKTTNIRSIIREVVLSDIFQTK
jgi:hypothetical protein